MKTKMNAASVLIVGVVMMLSSTGAQGSSHAKTQDQKVAADNSKMNDVPPTELNAQDQGNSDRDITLTQRIRKAVVSEKELSSDAKNVKIITIDGIVTLKGPVKTVQEVEKITSVASAIAGRKNIRNQMTVE